MTEWRWETQEEREMALRALQDANDRELLRLSLLADALVADLTTEDDA